MCLSASVSFIAAGVLATGGGFAVWKAWTINKRYLPIALMPIFAGIQQFMEGHVWMGLNTGAPGMIWWAAHGFYFIFVAHVADLGTVRHVFSGTT